MALNCIIVATNGLVPVQINQYLENARFFEVIGIYTTVASAKTALDKSVHYFLMDIQTAQANLADIMIPGLQDPKALIFSSEEVYFLENMKSGVNSVFLPGFENADNSSETEVKIVQDRVNVEIGDSSISLIEKLPSGPLKLSLHAHAVQIRPHGPTSSRGESIFVRSESRIARIRLDELLFVEAQKDYVVFHTAHQQFRVLNSMKRIERQLCKTHFFRIHRSYIVRLDKIHTIQSDEVQLDDYQIAVPIGPSFKTKLMKQLQLL